MPGATIDQEWARVEAELESGSPAPDLVVFYDGFNDIAGGVVEAALSGSAPPGGVNVLNGSRMTEYGRSSPSLDRAGGAELVGSVSADRYLETRRVATQELATRGTVALFIQQADAFTSSEQLEAVRWITRSSPAEVTSSDMAKAFDAAEARLSKAGVPSARTSARDAGGAVFIDPAHQNEEGARLSAEEVWRVLGDELGALAR